MPPKLWPVYLRREPQKAMFYFKGCVRCKGDLYRTMDQYGTFFTCLQCGHNLTDAEEFDLKLFGTVRAGTTASINRDEKVAA